MIQQYKIDLHTHSIISHDGGITREQYVLLLEKGVLDCIAITDHNETSLAIEMAERLGPKIIVGEEISTQEGEIIGLFLQKTVQANLTALETAQQIHEQGGIVYIPHPFEIHRQGIKQEALQMVQHEVDIVEVFNARSKWRDKSKQALAFAKEHNKLMASSSDAHCTLGMGSSFGIISEMPTRDSLIKLLREGTLQKHYAPLVSYLCPAVNKLKHSFIHYV